MNSNPNISYKIQEYERLLTKTTGIEDIFILVVDNNKLNITSKNQTILIDREEYIASIILETYHTQITRNIINVKKSFLYRKSIDNLIEENIQSLLVIPIIDKDTTLALIWIAIKDNNKISLPKQDIINNILVSIKQFLLLNLIENRVINKPQTIFNKNINILVADDNPIITKFIQASLKELDLNIIKVSTGEEAIEKFKTIKDLALIFMDEVMPNGIYGNEAIKQIRDIEKKNSLEPIIILALTSDATKRTFEKLTKAGANRVLYKPIKSKELLNIVKYFGLSNEDN